MSDNSLLDCLACAPQLMATLEQNPQLAALWQQLPRKTYAPNQPLLASGQLADRVWFVLSGLARMVHLSEQGEERNAAFQPEGSWLGWGAPPFACISPVGILALEITEVVELSYVTLRHWQAELPVVQTLLSDGIRAVLERSSQRQAELLLLDAPERYRLFLQQQSALHERIPLYHVASYLGITNVALSRIRKRMGLTQAAVTSGKP